METFVFSRKFVMDSIREENQNQIFNINYREIDENNKDKDIKIKSLKEKLNLSTLKFEVNLQNEKEKSNKKFEKYRNYIKTLIIILQIYNNKKYKEKEEDSSSIKKEIFKYLEDFDVFINLDKGGYNFEFDEIFNEIEKEISIEDYYLIELKNEYNKEDNNNLVKIDNNKFNIFKNQKEIVEKILNPLSNNDDIKYLSSENKQEEKIEELNESLENIGICWRKFRYLKDRTSDNKENKEVIEYFLCLYNNENRETFTIKDYLVILPIKLPDIKTIIENPSNEENKGFYNPPEKITYVIERLLIEIYKIKHSITILEWFYFYYHKNFKKDLEALMRKPQRLLSGHPGIGKSWWAEKLKEHYYKENIYDLSLEKENNESFTYFIEKISSIYQNFNNQKNEKKENMDLNYFSRTLQFFEGLSYSDFVQGIRPILDKSIKDESKKEIFSLTYHNNIGIFKEFCDKAEKKRYFKFIFIIEEFNRGYTEEILGDLFFLLDRRDKYAKSHIDNSDIVIPSNVIILATLNPDEGISDLKPALIRRFTTRTFKIEIEEYNYLYLYLQKICSISSSDAKNFVKKLQNTNKYLEELQKDNDDTEMFYQIGISFFLKNKFDPTNKELLTNIYEDEIKPLIKSLVEDLSINELDRIFLNEN